MTLSVWRWGEGRKVEGRGIAQPVLASTSAQRAVHAGRASGAILPLGAPSDTGHDRQARQQGRCGSASCQPPSQQACRGERGEGTNAPPAHPHRPIKKLSHGCVRARKSRASVSGPHAHFNHLPHAASPCAEHRTCVVLYARKIPKNPDDNRMTFLT